MKILSFEDKEIELLIDAIRSQARSGHLTEEKQMEATKLLVKIMRNEKGVNKNE